MPLRYRSLDLTQTFIAAQSGRWKRAKEIQHWLRERHQIRRRKIPTNAWRTVGELERDWWKAGAPVG